MRANVCLSPSSDILLPRLIIPILIAIRLFILVPTRLHLDLVRLLPPVLHRFSNLAAGLIEAILGIQRREPTDVEPAGAKATARAVGAAP